MYVKMVLNKLNLNNKRDWRIYNIIFEYAIKNDLVKIEKVNENNCELIANVIWNSFIQYSNELLKRGLIASCYDNGIIRKEIEFCLKGFLCEKVNLIILEANLNNSFAKNIQEQLFL